MTLRQRLLREAAGFADDKEISLARLATIVVNNGRFFRQLEAGGDCTTAVYERFARVFVSPKAWAEARAADRIRRLTASRQRQEATTRNLP